MAMLGLGVYFGVASKPQIQEASCDEYSDVWNLCVAWWIRNTEFPKHHIACKKCDGHASEQPRAKRTMQA